MTYVIKYVLLNVLGPAIPHPKIRSWYLRVLGARIGRNVRIENVRFIQIQGRLANFQCADNVFIGSSVLIDLSDRLLLGRSAIVAPGCSLITHRDFGDFNGNAVASIFPKETAPITIGNDAVVGCDTTILAGARIGSFSVIGAKSLVLGEIPANSLAMGIPARFVRKLRD